MKLALFARLEAKPGKEKEVAEFLNQGLALANQEATTLMWFALRLGPTTFRLHVSAELAEYVADVIDDQAEGLAR